MNYFPSGYDDGNNESATKFPQDMLGWLGLGGGEEGVKVWWA